MSRFPISNRNDEPWQPFDEWYKAHASGAEAILDAPPELPEDYRQAESQIARAQREVNRPSARRAGSGYAVGTREQIEPSKPPTKAQMRAWLAHERKPSEWKANDCPLPGLAPITSVRCGVARWHPIPARAPWLRIPGHKIDADQAIRLAGAIAEAGNTFVGPEGESIKDLAERWAELKPWPGLGGAGGTDKDAYPAMSRRFYYWYHAQGFASVKFNEKPAKHDPLFEQLYIFDPRSETRMAAVTAAWLQETGFEDLSPDYMLTPPAPGEDQQPPAPKMTLQYVHNGAPKRTKLDSSHSNPWAECAIESNGPYWCEDDSTPTAIYTRPDSLGIYDNPDTGWDSGRAADPTEYLSYRMWLKQGRIAETLDVWDGIYYRVVISRWTGAKQGDPPDTGAKAEAARGSAFLAGAVLEEARTWHDIQTAVAKRVRELRRVPLDGGLWLMRTMEEVYDRYGQQFDEWLAEGLPPDPGDALKAAWDRAGMIGQYYQDQAVVHALMRAVRDARAGNWDKYQLAEALIDAYGETMGYDHITDAYLRWRHIWPDAWLEHVALWAGGSLAASTSTKQNKRLGASLAGQPGGLLAAAPSAALIARLHDEASARLISYKPHANTPADKRAINYATEILAQDAQPKDERLFSQIGWDDGEPPDAPAGEDQAYDDRGFFYGELAEAEPGDYGLPPARDRRALGQVWGDTESYQDAKGELHRKPPTSGWDLRNTPRARRARRIVDAVPMTPRQREALDLQLEGLPYEAIAAQMGITEGAVGQHITRAKDAIGTAFSKNGQNSPDSMSILGPGECIDIEREAKRLSFDPEK